MIDELKKENFSLKMRIYYLTENLSRLSPEGMLDMVTEHAQMKASLEHYKNQGGQPLKVAHLEQQIKELQSALLEKNELYNMVVTEMENTRSNLLLARKQHEEMEHEQSIRIADLQEVI